MAAYNSSTQYTRRLDDFRGVDLTSGQVQVSPKRFAYAQNMWRDYSAELGGAIETMPGFRALNPFSGTIHGIWAFRPFEGELYVMVHAGTSLYQFKHADRDSIADDPSLITEYTGLADAHSTAFAFNGRFYILDGESFRVLKKTDHGFELSATEDTAYLPVTFINGEMYEQRNMLIDRTINRETQALVYDASLLYRYEETDSQGSLVFGGIIGFNEKSKSDSVIILNALNGSVDILGKPFDAVTSIEEGAFEGNTDIRRVTICLPMNGNQLAAAMFIASRAFADCTSLERVELCEVSLSKESFAGCTSLREIYLKDCGLTADVFSDCGDIVKISLAGEREIPDGVFGGCAPSEIWLDKCTGFAPVALVENEGYDAGHNCELPYIEEVNPDFDESAPVTLDNFPYLLESNPDYEGPAGTEFEIFKNNQFDATTHMVDYAVLMAQTRSYTDEFGDTEDVDIDWTDAAEYNKYPFIIEPVGNGRYRAKAIYKTGGSFGDVSNLLKVYTAYTAEELAADLSALGENIDALIEASGAELIYGTPTPVALERVATDESHFYKVSMTAREVIAYDPADSVERVEVDGEAISDYGVSYSYVDNEWYVDKVIITESTTDDEELTDFDIDVILNCKPGKFTTAEGYLDFAAGNTDYEGTSRDAIVKCTISATFDDRIFLTGNPALPNTIFYCQRDNTGYPNPAYWGVLNYVNDGVGQSPNVAMLATSDMLMVLKGNDPHDATIYYHTGVDSGNDVVPRLYPSERGLSGVGCSGIAVNFRDDAVFMSNAGLEAVGKQQVNLERTLTHRSSLVDRMMTRERLSESVATEWNGYLLIFTPSGNVYMADSRQMHQNGENVEYEWYLLSDVGVYEGQTEDFEQITGDVMLYDETGLRWITEEYADVYAVIDGHRYPVELPPSEPQFTPSGAVWESHAYKSASGSEVWLDEEGAELRLDVALFEGKVYIVAPSGRYSGGEFRCVTSASDIEGVLYFGTQDGTVCCFNTDKRDVPYGDEPPADGTIHRHWYTFNGRQIDSFLTTAYDHAGFPDLAKKTVKKSLVVHAKTFPGSRMEIRVRTNRNDEWRQVGMISVATYDFYSLDFASAPLQIADETLATIREKEKKWALKQLYFGSVGFMSPWGIYSAGYRFTVTGRIKS